ncbi:MAG: hypothetical protein Rubg2KO_06360 [Rubricoccaceae bacterium]
MYRLRFLLPIFVGVLMSTPASSQINTERMRTSMDSTGVKIELDASVAYASGNTNFLLAGVGGRIDVVQDGFESFLVGRASFSEADDVVFLRQSFAHLRFTRELGGPFAAEAFVQAEQNAQRLLQERFLGGAGIRITFVDSDAARLAIGITPMAEFERLSDQLEPDQTLTRLSQYLAARFQISEWTSVSNILYFQPAISSWDDIRVLNDFALDIELTPGVMVRTAANFRYDSLPPADVAERDFEIRNGLVVRL